MLVSLSNTNLWILAVGVAMVVVNAVASSRLAPYVAGFFARMGRHEQSHRGV